MQDELKKPSEMSEEERRAKIQSLREQLKLLSATPRSDWHREFERILRDEARPFGQDVVIRIEEELGIDPPRIDYLILDDLKRLMRGKDIFRIFRQHNICEYKNPHDSLNMRILSKAIGYANFYIGLAEHEEDRPRNEVSITVFRATKNRELFDSMIADGTLEKTDISGIYHVKKLTDLPFQILIGDELTGEEYAAYRVLSDHADEKDVALVVNQLRKDTNPESRESKQKLLEFVETKNPGITRRITGGDEEMASIFMEVFKPEIDERIDSAVNVAVSNSTRNNLFTYVQDGDMPLERAAVRAGMTTADFTESMKKAGYKVPQTA